MKSFTVKYTTEYSDGTSYEMTGKSFDNFEKAAAYAAEISKTHMGDDGVFHGEWMHNYESTFVEDAPKQLRITARIETV